jgi:hypothetical protein
MREDYPAVDNAKMEKVYGYLMRKDDPLIKGAFTHTPDPEETESPEIEAAEESGEMVHVKRSFLAELLCLVYCYLMGHPFGGEYGRHDTDSESES